MTDYWKRILTNRLGQSKRNLDIPNKTDFVKNVVINNRKTQVDKKIAELKGSISKYVFMQGDCEISIESASGGYLLEYVHPISEVIEKKLTFSVLCTKECATRFGRETFERMAKINFRIFGTITYFDE